MGRLGGLSLLLLHSSSALYHSRSSSSAHPSSSSSSSGFSADALLYESYNQLHQLSQTMPSIDSPTIIIVGRQTDGKSALLESLMGFHFNDVGGGTKTRRPIALQMQYHADREEPAVYLATANGERALSLAELKDHIERENHRLESLDAFAAEEIVVRIEYRYCPNLSIVDTPGLLVASAAIESPTDSAPAGGTAGTASAMARRARLQAAGVEQLIRSKLESPEAIILCVEDTNNWDTAPARAVVAACDPTLERTVVVSTKLDTKFCQFGAPSELSAFLDATTLHRRHPGLLGGPFFTSVPCGRVGGGAGPQHFPSHQAFQSALLNQEAADTQYVEALLPGWMKQQAGESKGCLGVSTLRHFLEGLLRERYLTNLRKVVPQLQQLDEKLAADLRRTELALSELGSLRVQHALREVVSRFADALKSAIRGTTADAAKQLRQTLSEEHADAGALVPVADLGRETSEGSSSPAASMAADAPVILGKVNSQVGGAASSDAPGGGFPSDHGISDGYGATSQGGLSAAVGDADAPLFGGAQYYRLMSEFQLAVMTLPDDLANEEEVINAMGLAASDSRSAQTGRSAAAIALQRSVEALRPLLVQLHKRLIHVLMRALPFVKATAFKPESLDDDRAPHAALERVAGDRLWTALEKGYRQHLAECVQRCADACDDDLGHPDRLVLLGCGPNVGPRSPSGSPRITGGGRGAMRTHLADASVAAESAEALASAFRGLSRRGPGIEASAAEGDGALVGAAVARYSVDEWKRRVCQTVTRKTHAYLMLQFVESLPNALATHLEMAFDGPEGLDLQTARAELQERRDQLVREHARVARMVQTFQSVSRVYQRGTPARSSDHRPQAPSLRPATTAAAPVHADPSGSGSSTTQGLSFMK